jgi:hypothetical protein
MVIVALIFMLAPGSPGAGRGSLVCRGIRRILDLAGDTRYCRY